MKYYHGSRNGNLTELMVEKSNDGYVYLTPNLWCGGALWCLSRSLLELAPNKK